jgi:hypothetical protein
LLEGTRKSLFVVDESNGLGEGGVVTVTDAHVSAPCVLGSIGYAFVMMSLIEEEED